MGKKIELSRKTITEDKDGNALVTGKLAVENSPVDAKDLTNKEYVDNAIAKAAIGGEIDTSGFALKTELPTKTSQLTNDSGFMTSIPDEYVTNSELEQTLIPYGQELDKKSNIINYSDHTLNEVETYNNLEKLNTSETSKLETIYIIDKSINLTKGSICSIEVKFSDNTNLLLQGEVVSTVLTQKEVNYIQIMGENRMGIMLMDKAKYSIGDNDILIPEHNDNASALVVAHPNANNVISLIITKPTTFEINNSFFMDYQFVNDTEKENWNNKVDKNELFSGDYNDLSNKPCYDTREIEIKEYTYDGTGTPFENTVKVSNDVFTLEDIRKGMNFKIECILFSDNSSQKINMIKVDESDATLDCVTDDNGVYAVYIKNYILIVLRDADGYTTGVYLTHDSNKYISYFSFEKVISGDFKPLDEAFLTNKPGKIVKVPCDCGDEDCNLVYTGEIFNDTNGNKAGMYSHAEGLDTWALGDVSHSEGSSTKAMGSFSHAEGYYTVANGNKSHAEGCGCVTNAESAHAEGFGTIANGNSQHAQGKYNAPLGDSYAHIVGNGSSDTNRKNAHTLDWNGNAWFAGKATVSVQPTDNNDLTTKLYVDQSIAQANETQTSSITQNIAGTYAEKTYVENKVEETKYTHPSAHPASMIITTDDRQFASAQEKDQWNIGYNHSQAAHAPTNAQKNSDITKAEIEAKLTGTITSHSHDVNSEGSKLATESFVQAEIVKSALEGQIDTSVFALKENIPTKVSQLENDMEYLPSLLGTYTKMEQYQIGNQNILPSDMVWKMSYLNTDGIISDCTNPNYIVTVNYIPVKESTTYAMFYNGASVSAVHYAFYNDNYELISHSKSSVSLIATPEDAAYFRTSILVTNPPISITAGSQVIDENGKLVEPSGLLEMYQQANTQYDAGKYFEREVLSRENFYVPFDCLLDGSIRLASCDFTIEYPAINIFDPKLAKSGYNSDVNGYGEFGVNEAYVCTDPVSVSPGDRLTIWKLSLNKLTAESKNARFISVYNKNYQLIECVSYLHEYVVPDNGKYVMVSLYLSDWDNNKNLMYVQRHESSVYVGYENPLESIYKIDPNCIDNLVIEELPIHTCLPPEICIPAGMTIELYNAQCCLEADKYHIQWVGQYGAAYDWKYSIVGEEELVGTSFTLTMNVINDALKVLKSEKTTVKIVSNVIDTNQLIIPIGDSLTNQKPWLENIHSVLSNGKVSFRGTRGTTDPTLVNGITHEGRSGAGSGWYNLGTSTYTFDSNGLSTLPDKAANPFWNPTSNAFDFDYYCNSTADGGAGYFQTESGANTSITPTGVMIFLGANGVTIDPSTQVKNIETLINNIRNSIKGAGIPIYVVNTHYRAPYILSTTADGFATNSGGEFKFQNDIKYQNLMRALNDKLSTKTNVSIVPVSVTHDSAHNFPYTEVNVNPYNDKFVERKYTDTIHPMMCGYLQMAATMYGSICANYKNQ